MIKIINVLISIISKSFPHLELKLKYASSNEPVEQFIKKTLFSVFYTTIAVIIFLWLVLAKMTNTFFLIFVAPILFMVLFFYFMRVPDMQIHKKIREINSEIVFAGRFLIIELKSGVPMYRSFQNVAKNYEAIGKYFSDIVTKIDLGTEIETALNDTIEFTPSPNFRKILSQIVNAQQTGADISTSLKAVVDQIAKEQLIEIKEYGRKLNPLAMFYMIIAVILPSIGITMFIILSTFLELTLELPILLVISAFLGFMQFMFLAIIKSSRPAVEL